MVRLELQRPLGICERTAYLAQPFKRQGSAQQGLGVVGAQRESPRAVFDDGFVLADLGECCRTVGKEDGAFRLVTGNHVDGLCVALDRFLVFTDFEVLVAAAFDELGAFETRRVPTGHAGQTWAGLSSRTWAAV